MSVAVQIMCAIGCLLVFASPFVYILGRRRRW